jgi:hypothetical protein
MSTILTNRGGGFKTISCHGLYAGSFSSLIRGPVEIILARLEGELLDELAGGYSRIKGVEKEDALGGGDLD